MVHYDSDIITGKHKDYLQRAELRTNRGFLPVADDITSNLYTGLLRFLILAHILKLTVFHGRAELDKWLNDIFFYIPPLQQQESNPCWYVL